MTYSIRYGEGKQHEKMLEELSQFFRKKQFLALLAFFYLLTITFTTGKSNCTLYDRHKSVDFINFSKKLRQSNAINARSQIRDVVIRFKTIQPFSSRVHPMPLNVENTNGRVSVLIFT